jgi:ATP-binding cassette subfamily B protein
MRRNTWNHVKNTLALTWELDRTILILMAALAFLRVFSPYISIFLSAYILDQLAAGTEFWPLLWMVLAGLAAVFLTKIAADYLDILKNRHITICLSRFDMKKADKTLEMDYQQLESSFTNDIRSKMETDRMWGSGFYSVLWQLPVLMEAIFQIIAAGIVLIPLIGSGVFFRNGLTPVFLVFLLAVSTLSALFQTKYTKKKTFELMDESEKHSSYMMYFIWGGSAFSYKQGKDIRLFDASRLIMSRVEQAHEEQVEWNRRFARVTSRGGAVYGIASGLLEGGAYLFVVLQAVLGSITVGSVLKYSTAVSKMASSIAVLVDYCSEFSATAKRQQSTMAYLNIPNVMPHGTLPVEKRAFCEGGDNNYEIEFKNVSFRYPGTEKDVLRNISLKLRIGERMAVVGRNGSGKTTFIKLLCRLYDPTEGEILLNGINIKKYDYEEYMSIFSVVFQDFRLFSFPLGQNVASNAKFDRARVEACLKQAGLGERLAQMPEGLETYLYKDFDEKGVEISGGEAQKIALARALYKDAPFIILDEPTAALDPIAEYEVYSNFNSIVGDKTAIYISHRLSSCRFCDDIAVFDEGKMVQRGSHEKLMEDTAGKYQELWSAQAQYYTKQ